MFDIYSKKLKVESINESLRFVYKFDAFPMSSSPNLNLIIDQRSPNSLLDYREI